MQILGRSVGASSGLPLPAGSGIMPASLDTLFGRSNPAHFFCSTATVAPVRPIRTGPQAQPQVAHQGGQVGAHCGGLCASGMLFLVPNFRVVELIHELDELAEHRRNHRHRTWL